MNHPPSPINNTLANRDARSFIRVVRDPLVLEAQLLACLRGALEGWLKTEGMHFDFLVRIEWEMQGDKLQSAE